ncbi:allophanate hydrolase [Anoxybacillus geothermalis]|uniref:Allophanate hydrolase n=1 Tax=Geobacillus zalihae TaxID=213419 RepID=A0A7H1RYD3_9BACL|nr:MULTISPECIES: allophanate hydrolase [Geobacillus]MED4876786.1 allophanate hydrolase [Anoxybacillus geothermalis]WJQ05909.1 allophanate hydrolase [Geobacillus stearothermophilus]EPR28400.1 Allophanate hydrolase [Geobacillus sp. WSUCF1]OQP21300.1 allophanate hydrolase [Geobacillus zalihae]QNU19272.1 allophanate hydrolase [Geobacillus zalihae]
MSIPRLLTIGWLRQMYEKGEITPKEVIDAIIQRAQKESNMNIWITPPSLDWIEPFLDQLKYKDFKTSPLWGVPFAIKDNIDLAGIPTTAGCPDYAYVPSEHAPVVQRLIDAGAIPVGKTNLDQFATGLVGVRSPYGETHNAFRPELISGGSSSGSAVAVARGHAAFALGTDTAGSGRVPAALNRLIGFKPSCGAWPVRGVVPACASLDCVTVFAHHLDDVLLVDSVVRGIDEKDPWSKEIPSPVLQLPSKIYLPQGTLDFFGPFANEYKHAWERAVIKLQTLGVPVEYIDIQPFAKAASLLYDGPFVAERWADLGPFIESHPQSTFPVTEQVLRSGSSSYDAASVFRALHQLQSIKLDVHKQLQNAVFVLPTCGGTWTRDQVREEPIRTNSDMGRYTNHCNLLDLCAVAVPAGDAALDLPFGVTFFALSGQEGLICSVTNLFLYGNQAQLQSIFSKENKETTLIAVCGLHMRGFPLEQVMHEHGARFVCEARTAAKYQLFRLPTQPAKPGLIKKREGGSAIQLEIWEMPIDRFGAFVASIPSPLSIGKVELEDGSEVPGFICEPYIVEEAEDITTFGGWKRIVHEQA